MNNDLLRQLPKIDVLLCEAELQSAAEKYSYVRVKDVAQEYVEELRCMILNGALLELPSQDSVSGTIRGRLERTGVYSMKRVVNATGVVLHTNLGRAPIGEKLAAHVAEIASGYSNLEYDLDRGERGDRYSHVEKLLRELTGAEAALVVNNNAAALFLMLNTMAAGKTVAVSRGELVEIGGSFRVPEIMKRSGASLMEIGTTNRTNLADYSRAVGAGAEIILKVHTSNYKMVGFTEEVPLRDLAELSRRAGCPLLQDLGSAYFFRSSLLPDGPVVRESVEAGADVVCFSGDKLTGASQAGILVGKSAYIEQMKKNQLLRILRIDKLSLAALEGSLLCSLDFRQSLRENPTLSMLSMPSEVLRQRAERLAGRLAARNLNNFCFQTMESTDEAGGGSLPGVSLPGWVVTVSSEDMTADALERRLRARSVPIIARIWRDLLCLSPRTLLAGDEDVITVAFEQLAGGE